MKNEGSDNSFIREPGAKPPDVTMRKGPLLPLTPGTRWVMDLKSGIRQGSEEVAVIEAKVPGNGKPAQATLEQRQRGKVYRQEIFALDDKALTMVAAGSPEDRMSMNPPIPLAKFPLQPGTYARWSGVLRMRSVSAPATALSRVAGVELVKTPAGTFGAYRINSVIHTTVEDKPVSFHTTRWIAPGVGIVKQKLLVGKDILVKELKSYHIAGQKPEA